jgi:hypothetical protein
MTWKRGDWVRFWTKNWPTDARVIRLQITDEGPEEPRDVTGQGLYMGRGKVVRVKDGSLLVREERSNRIVEVSPDERVEPMTVEYHLLTLGDLRKFLEEHKAAPDEVPVTVSLPVHFNCDEDGPDLELPDHPERHEPTDFHEVSACNISFNALELNSSVSADAFVPVEEQQDGEEWYFSVEISPNGKEAHDALRGEEHD